VYASAAIAAMKEAKRLAGARLGRIGYQGGSQGGWAVPLAVNRAPIDFAIISYGLAVTVLEEDQESVALDMYYHHHSAEDTKKALALARAGELVFETRGKEGYEAFDALRQKYKSEPWYKDVHGDFLFIIMPLNQEQIIDAMTKELGFSKTTPLPLRADAGPPRLHHAATLGARKRRSGSAQCRDGQPHQIADRTGQALYPGRLSRRGTWHDRI
jgi:uncharacterized protein